MELREQEQAIEQLSTRNNAAIVKAQQKDAVEKAECENKRQQIETAAQAFAESALRETAIHIVHMDVPTSFVRQAEPVAQQKVRDLAAGQHRRPRQAAALFADLGLPAGFSPERDRVMLCGSMAMIKQAAEVLETFGMKEGSNAEPGVYVLERAFVG